MKKIIVITLIGIAILFASLTILISKPVSAATGAQMYTCSIDGLQYSTLGTCQDKCFSTNTKEDKIAGICTQGIVVTPDYINQMVQKYTQWFMAIVGSIAVLVIIWAGLKYIMAKGDPENTKAARKMIMYALIGLAIVLLAGGAMWTISSFLKFGT